MSAVVLLVVLLLVVLLHEQYKWPVFPVFVGASDDDGSDDVAADLFRCRPPRVGDDGHSNALDDQGKPRPDDRSVFDRMPKVSVRSVVALLQ